MINLNMWYNDDPNTIDSITYTFYANDGQYRGNLFKAGRIVGDYTADNSVDIEKRFDVKLN